MVQLIDTSWTVVEDTPERSGRHFTHRLQVDMASGPRGVVLKASQDGEDFCHEGRLLTVLEENTELPVPSVLGVVDEHDEFPAPIFLMEELPGESIHKSETDTLSDATLRCIAVSSGRHLAELHRLDAVDSYGVVAVNSGKMLHGERPKGDLGQLRISDGDESWPTHIESSIEGILDGLPDSPFEDVVVDVRPVVSPMVDNLRTNGPFDPVIGRVEQSMDNILVDVESGDVTGMLDWEFVASMTAANDLVLAEFWLSGGPWGLLPSTPDYRPLVREGLLEGYCSVGGELILDEYHSHRDRYELLLIVRTMLFFDGICDAFGATDTERDAAASNLRSRLSEVIDRNS